MTKELPSSGNISLICKRAVRSWISSSVSSSSLMVNSLKSWICFSCIESGNISENKAKISANDEDRERDNSWTKFRWSKSSWDTSRKYSKSSCVTKIFNKWVIFSFFWKVKFFEKKCLPKLETASTFWSKLNSAGEFYVRNPSHEFYIYISDYIFIQYIGTILYLFKWLYFDIVYWHSCFIKGKSFNPYGAL